MLNIANKLNIMFNNMKLPKPGKLAEQVKIRLMDFKPFLPIIRALTCKGLVKRHWEEIEQKTEIVIKRD